MHSTINGYEGKNTVNGWGKLLKLQDCVYCAILNLLHIKHENRRYDNILIQKKHVTALKSAKTNRFITSFLPKQNTPENIKISIIKLSQIYHGLQNNHSYCSIDCRRKIDSLSYFDSETEKKIIVAGQKPKQLSKIY